MYNTPGIQFKWPTNRHSPVFSFSAAIQENREPPAYSSENNADPSLKFDFIISPHLINLDQSGILRKMVDQIKRLAISNNASFNSLGYFQEKNIEFSVVMTTYEKLDANLTDAFYNSDGNALTSCSYDKSGRAHIEVYLLYDRLFFDQNGKQRNLSDGFVRTLAALSHEIYGNVQAAIKCVKKGMDFNSLDRREQEINAFSTGIEFLNKVLKSTDLNTYPPALREEINQYIKEALIREQDWLETWKNASLK